jgi:hypothetical protein
MAAYEPERPHSVRASLAQNADMALKRYGAHDTGMTRMAPGHCQPAAAYPLYKYTRFIQIFSECSIGAMSAK